MRCSTRVIAATVVGAVSLVPLTVAARAAAAGQSLPPALASFLTEEAHATSADRVGNSTRTALTATKARLEAKETRP